MDASTTTPATSPRSFGGVFRHSGNCTMMFLRCFGDHTCSRASRRSQVSNNRAQLVITAAYDPARMGTDVALVFSAAPYL